MPTNGPYNSGAALGGSWNPVGAANLSMAVVGDDASYAIGTARDSFLWCLGYNTAPIPATDVIQGFLVEHLNIRNDFPEPPTDTYELVSTLDGATSLGAVGSWAYINAAPSTYLAVGGPTNMLGIPAGTVWGALTPNFGFGFVIRIAGGGTVNSPHIDHIRVTVYTSSGGGASVIRAAAKQRWAPDLGCIRTEQGGKR